MEAHRKQVELSSHPNFHSRVARFTLQRHTRGSLYTTQPKILTRPQRNPPPILLNTHLSTQPQPPHPFWTPGYKTASLHPWPTQEDTNPWNITMQCRKCASSSHLTLHTSRLPIFSLHLPFRTVAAWYYTQLEFSIYQHLQKSRFASVVYGKSETTFHAIVREESIATSAVWYVSVGFFYGKHQENNLSYARSIAIKS